MSHTHTFICSLLFALCPLQFAVYLSPLSVVARFQLASLGIKLNSFNLNGKSMFLDLEAQ